MTGNDDSKHTDSCSCLLPPDLAPSLTARVQQLLAEVAMTTAPDLVVDLVYAGPRCIVCHEGGKLGGHHDHDGQVEWIHKACHRKLHHRFRLTRSELGRIHQRERLAC